MRSPSNAPIMEPRYYRGFERRETGRSWHLRCLVGVERGKHIEQCSQTFQVYWSDYHKPGWSEEIEAHRDAHKASIRGFDEAVTP